MIRNLSLLILNDLAISYRNKTIFLVCFVPLFVFFVLSVVDNPGETSIKTKLGLIRGGLYPDGMTEALPAAGSFIDLSWIDNEAAANKALVDRNVDGYLKPGTVESGSATLVVIKRDSVTTLTLLETLGQLQEQAEGRARQKWVKDISPLIEGKGIGGETIAIWILMVILLVGFMVLPPQIAEEKEKKLILGLLQTPIREAEWLSAKVIVGMILSLTPVALLHSATRIGVSHAFGYIAILLAGSFCFTSMGLLLGMLCKSQGSARALGVVFYLPHLLPSALSDYSKQLNAAAAFVPSYPFFTPIKAMILEDADLGQFLPQALSLLVMGTLCYTGASIALKKRWLM